MSLTIFYTGADESNTEQKSPIKSLGGKISSSKVPNDFIGNLFPAISQLAESEKRVDVRAIAVQNISGATFVSFTMYVAVDEKDEDLIKSTWEMGFAIFALDECGDLTVEELPNPQASPLNVTLVEGGSSNKKLTLPLLDDKNYVGIYLRRTVKSIIIDDDELEDNFDDEVVLPNEETLDIVFQSS